MLPSRALWKDVDWVRPLHVTDAAHYICHVGTLHLPDGPVATQSLTTSVSAFGYRMAALRCNMLSSENNL